MVLYSVLSVFLLILTAWAVVRHYKLKSEATKNQFMSTPIQDEPPIQQDNPEQITKKPNLAEKAVQKSKQLQQTTERWAASKKGSTSVVIIEPTSEQVLVAVNPQKKYFAASLYKLLVVYYGYQQIDNGKISSDQQILKNLNSKQCLDKAIRSSDSPCGETLRSLFGAKKITSKIQKKYQLQNIDAVNITVNAKDAAEMMAMIWRSDDLSDQSRTAFLDSLKDQPALYRRGLPKGFDSKITVYNKVGWNYQKEWHDAAILEFEDGSALTIAVLSENVGMRSIANLGKQLQKILLSTD